MKLEVIEMSKHGMHEAKTNLSKLVERALEGEEIVLTRRGKPAVKLVPYEEPGGMAAAFGALAGQFEYSEDWEWPEDIRMYLEGEMDDFTDKPIDENSKGGGLLPPDDDSTSTEEAA